MTRKQELLERKYIDIDSDYKDMFVEGLRVEIIYERLSQKYYLDEGTISRITRRDPDRPRKRKASG